MNSLQRLGLHNPIQVHTRRVQVRYSNSSYQLRAALLNDASTWASSAWFSISDAAHSIEVDWRAATAVGANNGALTLWIDGAQRASLAGVDNDSRRIDRIRLGAVAGIDSGTRVHTTLTRLSLAGRHISGHRLL